MDLSMVMGFIITQMEIILKESGLKIGKMDMGFIYITQQEKNMKEILKQEKSLGKGLFIMPQEMCKILFLLVISFIVTKDSEKMELKRVKEY